MSPKAGSGWKANVLKQASTGQVSKNARKKAQRQSLTNEALVVYDFVPGPRFAMYLSAPLTSLEAQERLATRC